MQRGHFQGPEGQVGMRCAREQQEEPRQRAPGEAGTLHALSWGPALRPAKGPQAKDQGSHRRLEKGLPQWGIPRGETAAGVGRSRPGATAQVVSLPRVYLEKRLDHQLTGGIGASKRVLGPQSCRKGF